jgi:type I restriction enzyme S subunit
MEQNIIPEGHKQTEVGVIPNDWDVSSLVDITQTKRPISYGIVQTGSNVIDGVRCLRVLDITDGRICKRNLITTTQQISDSYKRTQLKENDLVIPLRGKVGEVGIVDEDLIGANLTRGVGLIALKKDFNSQYFKQLLSWEKSAKRILSTMSGSALQEIAIASLRSFKVSYPKEKEQTAIANVLSDVDALIGSIEKLIAKKQAIKTATMQQLLTGKKRLPPFDTYQATDHAVIQGDKKSGQSKGTQQTELGEIPEDWAVETISSISAVPMQNGLFYEPSRKGQGISLINVGDMYKSAPIDVEQLELFNANIAEIKTFRVSSGDLFFTRSSIVPSGIAFCNIYESENVERDVVFDSHLIRVRANAKMADAKYVYLACLSNLSRKFLISSAKTATMTTIDQGAIKDCPIILPSLGEQKSIINILSDMDFELESIKNRLAKTQQIKQGMMQELLTGKTRLPVADL